MEPPNPASAPFSSTEVQPPQPLRSMGESPTRPAPTWGSPQPSMDERKPESGPIFQKPGMEMTARQEQQFPGYSSQPQGPQSTPVPPKWAPNLQRLSELWRYWRSATHLLSINCTGPCSTKSLPRKRASVLLA